MKRNPLFITYSFFLTKRQQFYSKNSEKEAFDIRRHFGAIPSASSHAERIKKNKKLTAKILKKNKNVKLTHRHVFESIVFVVGFVPLEHFYHSLWILFLFGLGNVRILEHNIPILGHSSELPGAAVEANMEGVFEVGGWRNDRFIRFFTASVERPLFGAGSVFVFILFVFVS